MIRRCNSPFVIYCLLVGVFTILLLGSGQGGWHINLFLGSSENNFGEYFSEIGIGEHDDRHQHRDLSLFRLPRKDKIEASTENEEDDGNELLGDIGGMDPEEEIGEQMEEKSKTVILMWTKYYHLSGQTLMNMILSGREYDPSCCTGDDIIISLDRKLLPNATVVVFYHFYSNLKTTDLPKARPPGQLWVLFSKESPTMATGLNAYSDTFNWTMSYRQDSDIYTPYGFTTTLQTPIPTDKPILMPGDIPLDKWVANKTGMLAGVISHCHTPSKRERLAKALQNATLPVDIYGTCGPIKICPRRNLSCDHDKFWLDLAAKYRFYFAAENSLCVDYITEKFWRTLQLGMVPLVYGGANYTQVAPPHSFIDASQFKSPKEIAVYLQKLAQNPKKYSKYFEWKRNYEVTLTDAWGGWCRLCELAKQYKNNPEDLKVSPNKSDIDLNKWWLRTGQNYKESACHGPPFPL